MSASFVTVCAGADISNYFSVKSGCLTGHGLESIILMRSIPFLHYFPSFWAPRELLKSDGGKPVFILKKLEK